VFAPGGAKPAAAGLDDNSLVVPGFGESAAAAGAGAARWCFAGVMGGMQGDVGPSAAPRFGGNEVPGFGG
jgi:hypothetical protein